MKNIELGIIDLDKVLYEQYVRREPSPGECDQHLAWSCDVVVVYYRN